MKELKPCPFCGNAARIADDGHSGKVYWVGCDYRNDCNVHPSLVATTEEEAIEKWNSRSAEIATWKQYDIDSDTWECSNCSALWTLTTSDNPFDHKMRYCPECGAGITAIVVKESRDDEKIVTIDDWESK